MKFILFFILALLPLLFPTPTYAHAFGQSYVLPVPFWLYSYGAAAALIVSFLIAGFFINEKKVSGKAVGREITNWKVVRFFRHRATINVLKLLSVFFAALTLFSGLFGTIDPGQNFNMTFFWIIFFLGLTYASAIFGNIFSVLNPWKIIIEWFENKTGSSMEEGVVPYPKWFGYVPALVGYIFFIWLELVSRFGPAELSFTLFIYSVFTFLSIYMFGKKEWFEKGEFFSVYFRLFSRVAPVQEEHKKYYLRLPFAGLLKEKAAHGSLVFFILFMLCSTAFDSFRETVMWMDQYFLFIQVMSPPDVPWLSLYAPHIVETFGLIASLLLFWIVYMVFMFLMKITTQAKQSVNELGKAFIFSLLPIALVYNVAHYYTLFVNQGQFIIQLISDPFGYGWNIFGTGEFYPTGLLDMNFIWHSQVGLILLGHVVAVILAHIVALRVFPSHKKAVISQFPMLILMVIFTMAGLWVLSQPLGVGL